ncbi:MAG: hypothetical protein H0T79_17425, partial [Deltaproteobacteria bacterium]|nr:hypothetical protein [Deltaproteobacteria bacterium]
IREDAREYDEHRGLTPYCTVPPDPGVPACRPPEPFVANILSVTIAGSDSIITIDAGADRGLTKEWHGVMLTAEGSVSPGRAYVILRVDRRSTTGRVQLTHDQIQPYRRVRLIPP